MNLVLLLAGITAALPAQSADTIPVPAMPPDTVAAWVFADSNIVRDPAVSSAAFHANVISVRFRRGASQAARQQAIDGVGGVVVGGDASATTAVDDGVYYVRIDAGRRWGPLGDAAQALRRMPQVAMAVTLLRVSPGGGSIRVRKDP